MNNPGLGVFSADTFIRSPHHPLNIDPLEDDPDLEEGENDSDYIPPVSFGRWRTPGHTVHVPVQQGPAFGPGHSPEDVIHGEVVSPAEQDSADRIIHGEHDSDAPSANPYVEQARQDLHSSGSGIAVDTLTKLLNGAHPQSMSREAMEATHQWLSRHFTGVKVNPHHGVLEAASPAGAQLVRRHPNLPAIPEETHEPAYSLVNKHGTFESRDPERLIRTMVAFQIVHNELAKKKKKDDNDDQNSGLSSTSGIVDRFHQFGDWLGKGIQGPPPPRPAKPSIPPSAVFEPGNGIDTNDHGQRGGYVMDAALAPLDWHRHEGTAYSPGHHMRLMLDPHEAIQPRSDPRYPGHTFTYAPNVGTGHTEARVNKGINYWVQPNIHPAARSAGFDLPLVPKPPKAPPTGRVPKKGPKAQPHQPPLSLPPAPGTPITIRRPPKTSAAASNDLCPVCASGYLEPYDREFHECLNCGSLVKHVGFEKHAGIGDKRKPGGLGNGLKQIMPYEGNPMDLPSDDSENTEYVVDDQGNLHPLANEVLDPDYQGYTAPRSILGALVNRHVNEDDNLRFFEDTDFPPARGENYTNQPMISFKPIHDRDDAGGEDWDAESRSKPVDVCETCYLDKGKILSPKEHHWENAHEHEFKPIENHQRFSSSTEPDLLDEHMGKLGLQPHHKPGQSRMYMMQMPRTPGGYLRLTEGVPNASGEPSGWALTADHIPRSDQWTIGEDSKVPQRHIVVDRMGTKPGQDKPFKQPLPDLGDRQMAQKTFLAGGSHPVDDPVLYHAIKDMAENGRDSNTYWNAFNRSAYEPPRPPSENPEATQRDLRMLSTVSNPGLDRFIS